VPKITPLLLPSWLRKRRLNYGFSQSNGTGALHPLGGCHFGGGVGCDVLESSMIPAAEFEAQLYTFWLLCQAEAWE
jgi:hypothetical protein